MQIFLSLTEWKRLVNTYGMSSAAAAAKSNTDFHSLRTKAEARGLLPSNFLILLLLDHRRGIKKTRTIHAIYESFIIREVLNIPIFFAAHKNQTPREGGQKKWLNQNHPEKREKKCSTTKNRTLLFRENMQLLFSVSVLLCNNTDVDDDDESANVLRKTLRKKLFGRYGQILQTEESSFSG